MGEVRTLGDITAPTAGGAVYEDTYPHRVIGSVTGIQRAMKHAETLASFDQPVVKPLFAKGARRRPKSDVFPDGVPNPYAMKGAPLIRLPLARRRVAERIYFAAAFVGSVLLVSSGLTAIVVTLLHNTWSAR